jgi:RNA polymerase sigma-B factor
VPGVRTIPQPREDAVAEVLPGDQTAATTVQGWLEAYATSRDPQLREQIILAYLGLADRLAKRYRHSAGTIPEDLIQTTRAGLIAAVDRYDPDHGSPFVPYGVACVVGELKRHLRDTSWRLHVPRPLKKQALQLWRAAEALHQRLGRAPTTIKLAEQLGVDEERVLEALAAVTSHRELSLDQPAGTDPTLPVGDLVAAPAARKEPEDLLALPELVAALPDQEREVIIQRFFQDLDQDTIAARIGCSQMHVSRLQRRTLACMRASW